MRPDTRAVAGLSVVVLGGTGFLGRHIGAAFTALGARVHPVSRTGDTHPAVRLDLLRSTPPQIARLLADTGADVVVNAAGRVWQGNEADMAEGNVKLVDHLVSALPGRPIRLVQLGSVHEYGPGARDAATGEDHPPEPVTAYGRTKLAGTQAVLRATAAHRVDGVVLRLANVLGAGAPPGSLFGRVASRLAEIAGTRSERPAELRIPPLNTARDLVDATDAAAAVVAASVAPAVTGQVINIGRGEAVPMRSLIDRMIALSGLDVTVIEDAAGPASRTDVAWQRLDVSRARRLLNWSPHQNLDDSLRGLLAPVLPPMHRSAPGR